MLKLVLVFIVRELANSQMRSDFPVGSQINLCLRLLVSEFQKLNKVSNFAFSHDLQSKVRGLDINSNISFFLG